MSSHCDLHRQSRKTSPPRRCHPRPRSLPVVRSGRSAPSSNKRPRHTCHRGLQRERPSASSRRTDPLHPPTHRRASASSNRLDARRLQEAKPCQDWDGILPRLTAMSGVPLELAMAPSTRPAVSHRCRSRLIKALRFHHHRECRGPTRRTVCLRKVLRKNHARQAWRLSNRRSSSSALSQRHPASTHGLKAVGAHPETLVHLQRQTSRANHTLLDLLHRPRVHNSSNKLLSALRTPSRPGKVLHSAFHTSTRRTPKLPADRRRSQQSCRHLGML